MTNEERAVIDSMQLHLRELGEDAAKAVAEISDMSAAMTNMSETLLSVTSKLSQLFEQQQDMNARVNRYILDQSRQDGKVAQLEKHVSEIRRKCAASG